MYFFSASHSFAPHTNELHTVEHKISRSADLINASIEKIDPNNLKPLALHRDLPSTLTNEKAEKPAAVEISTNERAEKVASVERSTNEKAASVEISPNEMSEKPASVGITASKVVESVNGSGGLNGGKDIGSVPVVASNSVVTLATLVAKS